MSLDLANAVAKFIREKIDDEEITKSLKIMMEGSFLFERLPTYNHLINHRFDIIIRGKKMAKSQLPNQHVEVPYPSVYLYHSIGNIDYDEIEFFNFGEDKKISFEYHMDDRAINNVIYRRNYPEEWEMFSDKMPWGWIREQFRLTAIKSL